MRKATIAAGLAVAVTFAGCSAPKLLYQRLDWIAAWQMDDYVSLNPEQNAQFKQAFAQTWEWHRREELPAYAKDLREIAVSLDQPRSAEQVAKHSARLQAHMERTTGRLVVDLCPVIRSLDDAQASEVLEGVDEDIKEFSEEYVEPPEEAQRRKSEKRTTKWIKRWTGPLNSQQKELIASWGTKRLSLGPQWLEYRKQWRDDLREALDQRAAAPDCAPLQPLFVRPMDLGNPELTANQQYNEALWNQLVADVIAAADAKQREHARKELLDLAEQLEKLSQMSG
jgi:hypothetical protein